MAKGRVMKSGFTEQEMSMIAHYMETPINLRSQWQSYMYAHGCSENTAKAYGPKKFAQPHIQEYLDQLVSETMKEVKVTTQDALKVIKEIMEDETAKPADRLVAAEKIMKYTNAYKEHEEAGAAKQTFLGMSEDQLREEAQKLLERVAGSGLISLDVNQKKGEYVDFENVEDAYSDDEIQET